MANYTRNTLTGILGPVNSELQKIEQSIEDKFDRKPSVAQSNALTDVLDANNNRIINLASPIGLNDAVRLKDLQVANGQSILPVQENNEGAILSTDGTTAFWRNGEEIPRYVDTFDSLDNLSPSVGSIFICIERANAKYIVQPLGYVSLAGDVTFANSLIGKLQIQNNTISIKAFGVVADGVTDDTLACNVAGGTNYVIDISGLPIYITNQVSFKYLKGNTVKDSKFLVDGSFNLSATAIVRLAADDGSYIEGGVGVECFQPNVSTRAEVIQYPWALDFRFLTRVTIDNFRCSGAWNGVNALGNTGGVKIGTMEIGALNEGLAVDGALDFWHVTTLHLWPFGFVLLPNVLNNIYYDATTIGARIGKCDGLDIKTISAFRTRIITESGSGSGPFGNIGALQLDGSYSVLEFGAGHVSIASLYSTSGHDNDRALVCTGGELNIATHDTTPFVNSVTTIPHVECNGGALSMGVGVARASMVNAPNFQCTSGSMSLMPTEFLGGVNTARTIGFINQTGGRFTLVKPRFRDIGSGSGNALTVSVGSWSSIDVDSWLGWDYSIPATLGSSIYNLSKVKNAVPTISFDTVGNFVPTYTANTCNYTIKDNYIDFELNLNFNTNAYTTAAGAMRIELGIPHVASATVSVNITDMSNFVFGVNQQFNPIVEGTVSRLRMRTANTGAVAANFSSGNIPASTTGMAIRISGRYRAA